jgi:uroporphyrinogen III methyltransferase/synthase
MLLEGKLQVVTFTSASAVKNFVQIYGADQAADLLSRTCVATIGPVTTEAAERLGIKVTVQAAPYTVPALVEAIARHMTAVKAAVAPAGA